MGKWEGVPRPLAEAEADEAIGNTLAEIESGGLWSKVCNRCGTRVGGRLAKYGKPPPEDLARVACPACSTVGNVRVEFIPPRGEQQ